MNKKQYATPQANVVEMENEDMIALSNDDKLLKSELGNDNQFVKDVELPSDLTGNRKLWDDKW